MTRLDWESANQRERHRVQGSLTGRPSKATKRHAHKRTIALADFATKHKLSCFVCGCDRAEWAKSGISKRGPWIICVSCVTSGKQSKPVGPIAERSK